MTLFQCHGRPFPGSGYILKLPDFLDAFATGSGRPSLGSGDMFVLPTFDSDFDPRPGKLLPESGDMVPESVASPCLHTLTSAGSGPRQFSASATGHSYVSFRRLRYLMPFYLYPVGPPFAPRVKWPECACAGRMPLSHVLRSYYACMHYYPRIQYSASHLREIRRTLSF